MNAATIARQLATATEDQAAALVAPLTGRQLAEVAEQCQPRVWLTRRTVAERRAELAYWTAGRRAQCSAVAGM